MCCRFSTKACDWEVEWACGWRARVLSACSVLVVTLAEAEVAALCAAVSEPAVQSLADRAAGPVARHSGPTCR